MARLSKEDWLKEGFKILSHFDQNKLRILYLCERLKVTRGSFYHHFNSIENYTNELMQAWEKKNTLDIIQASNKGVKANERMELLTQNVLKSDQSIEAAIRSWSFYNPIVKQYLDKVDEIRMAHLESIFKQSGIKKAMAKKRAKLDYALLIGMQQLFPNNAVKEMESLNDLYQKLI